MNNENSQAQAKSHAGGNDKLGINFAWPKNEGKVSGSETQSLPSFLLEWVAHLSPTFVGAA